MIIQCANTLIRNNRFSKRNGRNHGHAIIRPEKSRQKFPCRTISNPEELMKLGYNTKPSQPMIPMIPVNDYDVLKKVAWTTLITKQPLIGELLMTYLTNIYESKPKKIIIFKKHSMLFDKNVEKLKSRFYKLKKDQLRMSWNDALLKLNSTHVNDYDVYDEVA